MKKILILFLFSFMSIGGIFSQGDIKKGSTTVQIVEGNPNLISNNIPNAKYKQRLAYDNVNGVMWEFVGSDDGSVGQWLEAVNTKVENVSTDINLSDEFEYKKNGTSVFYNVMIAPINFNVNAGDTIIVYENGFVTNTITSGALNVNAGSLISVLKNGNTFNTVVISGSQGGNIDASSVDITNGTFVGQDLEQVLENLNTAANTPDGDGDSGNEIQDADAVNVTDGAYNGQNVEQALNTLDAKDYWTLGAENQISRNSKVVIGSNTGYADKGEIQFIDGKTVQILNNNSYVITGCNSNVPEKIDTSNVLIIPFQGGGVHVNYKIKFFNYNQVNSNNVMSEYDITCFTFNYDEVNSIGINVNGADLFYKVKIIPYGNNQYGIAFYGYNDNSISFIKTEVVVKYNYNYASFNTLDNYLTTEKSLLIYDTEIAPVTSSDYNNRVFNVDGQLFVKNVPNGNSDTIIVYNNGKLNKKIYNDKPYMYIDTISLIENFINTYGIAPVYSDNITSLPVLASTTNSNTLHHYYLSEHNGNGYQIHTSDIINIKSNFNYQVNETYYLQDDGTFDITADSNSNPNEDYVSAVFYVIANLGNNNYTISTKDAIHF